MKFILGYRPGSKSKLYDGPEVILQLTTRHKGKRYTFERILRDDNGFYTNQLCVYDTNDYPDAMIQSMIANKQIVEWHGDKIITVVGR